MKPMTPAEHLNSREEFWNKNKRLSRPISPHMTIYKPQVTSMLSITHRGTGLAQSGILSMFGVGAIVSSSSFPVMLDTLQSMQFGTPLIFLAKFAIAWPMTFHLFNGCRHLVCFSRFSRVHDFQEFTSSRFSRHSLFSQVHDFYEFTIFTIFTICTIVMITHGFTTSNKYFSKQSRKISRLG
jgi:succinate dehydrogenase cytochrome b556 subunit